jgi:thioredoxin
MLLAMPALFVMNSANAQNTFEETIPYKELDGKMIIRATVGGVEGDFLLDPRGRTSLTKEAAEKRKAVIKPSGTIYRRKDSEVIIGKASMQGFYVGKNVYSKGLEVFIIKNTPLIESLGVDGVIGFEEFGNVVFCINSKAKTIITSAPYKPAFIDLANRNFVTPTENGLLVDVELNGKTISMVVDFYSKNGLTLNDKDQAVVGADKVNIVLGREQFANVKVNKGGAIPFSILGNELLNKGIIAFDMTKEKYYFQPFGRGEDKIPVAPKDEIKIIAGKVNAIDRAYFLDKVYNYKESKTWKLKGDKPVIIDFWATWCGPCMRMMPIMEEMAAKYKDQVIFYKVNVDKEGELRQVFEANAIPMMFFAPVNGKMIKTVGADSKEKVEGLIVNQLLKK